MKFSTPTVLFTSTLVCSANARLEGFTSSEGLSNNDHETWQSRIVGGKAASRDEYPYFVSWGGCAASLIAPDVILSAAHCGGISNNNVIVGAYQKWWGQTSGSAEARRITERRVHPNYNAASFENDFTIMKLDEPITTLDPVKINFDPQVPIAEATLTAIGFGTIFQGGWGPRLLQEVDVKYVSHNQCNEEYSGEIVEEVMLCAGVEGGGKDSCQGDSGGPIVQKTDEGHIQVGVVSWGQGCALPDYSGVYSRISGAKSWIESQICELSADPPTSCSNIINSVNPAPAPEPVTLETSAPDTPAPVSSAPIPIPDTPAPVSSAPVTPETSAPDTPAPVSSAPIPVLDTPAPVSSVPVSLSVSQNQSVSRIECVDSETGTFETDDINGIQGCEWLRQNVQYKYLCAFTDVALTCPALCDACEIFA